MCLQSPSKIYVTDIRVYVTDKNEKRFKQFVNNKKIENSIKNFWKINSYGTTKDASPSVLP